MVVSTCLLKTEMQFQTGTWGMTSNITMKEGHSVKSFNTYGIYSRTKQLRKMETLSMDRYMDGSKYNDN
ncbi:hypothetical protein BMS3Bbin15_00409 [archaeon BMS3Bbin15]|nr:hypothetical protein BMS3Bbin15_00409 [archaeon BMS3Bbin15]